MPTKLTPEQQSAVRYWPSIAKIPIIPCTTYPKKSVKLNNWSKTDFTKVDFDAQLAAGAYDSGIALRLGKTLSSSSSSSSSNELPTNNNNQRYSFALDFDGLEAVEKWFVW